MRGRRLRGWAALGPAAGAVVGLVVLLGTASACVPQPLITLRPESSGPPGTRVTVEGLAVAGAVEIRWNAFDGEELAKASGPTFSVPVTIPSVPDGLYAVVVVERRPDGSIGSTGSTAFLVTGAHEPPAAGTSASTSSSTLAESPPRSSRGGAATPVAFGGGIALGGVAGAVVVRGRRRR